jgi:tetratricopeptide (TPR) repeat protein
LWQGLVDAVSWCLLAAGLVLLTRGIFVRTLNLQLTVILMTIGIVFGGGFLFLHAYQVERNAYVFKRESEVLEQRGESATKKKDDKAAAVAYRDAARNLSWYVRLVPHDIDAMAKLGLMTADLSRDYASRIRAFGLMEQVLREDPERTKVRRKLVPVAIHLGRFQDAKVHLQELLKDSPQDPDLLDLLGQCHLGRGEFESAANNFKKVVDLAPDRLETYKRLAVVVGTYQSLPLVARQWIDKMVQRNPKNWDAHLKRGIHLASANIADEALPEALKSLELKPDNSDALILAARCYLVKRDIEKSRQYAVRGLKLYPDRATMYINMADVESASKNNDKAIAIVRQGLAVTGQSPQLLWTLTNRLIDTNRLPEAKTTIDTLRARHYESTQEEELQYKPLLEYLNARLEMAQGHWLAASQGFEKSRRNVLTPEGFDLRKLADMAIGTCYGRLGSVDQQIDAFRRALRNDPGLTSARAGLAEALLNSGNPDEALREFRELQKQEKLSAGGMLSLARLLIYKTFPIAADKRDWRPVETLLNAAEKAAPDSVQLVVVRSQLLVAQNRLADAASLLQKAQSKAPRESDIWKSLIELAEGQQEWTKAERLVEDSRKALGDTVEQRLFQAQYLVQRSDPKTAGRLQKLAENVDQFSDAQRAQLWTGLASAASLVNDPQHAKQLLQRIADKDPNNVQVRYQLVEQALRTKNEAGLEQALKGLEGIAGQDGYWHYGQARRLSWSADDKKLSKAAATAALNDALKHLSQARELRPSWPRIVALTAIVYGQMGKLDSALNSYLEAIELGERNPQIIQRAIQLLFAKQRYDDANRLLHQFEQQTAVSPDMNRLSASVALQQKDFDRAVETARKAAAGSKNYETHLWLGQVLSVVSRQAKADGHAKNAEALSAEAEKAFRHAVEIEPKITNTWVALIQFLSTEGAKDRAEQAISEASQKIPAKQAPLALAQCYEAMQKVDEAQKKYEAALAAAPDDPLTVHAVADFYCRAKKSKQAEEQLNRMIDRKVASPEIDVLWARRQLALITANRGGYQDFQKARELIDKNLAAPEVSLWDRRVSAVIDASDPFQAHRKEALSTFESIVQDQSATPEDHFELARMYLEAGNWIQASVQLRNLVASQSNEPRYLIAYVDALLEHGEMNNAEIYLERLEKLSPNLIDTVALRARMFVVKNEPDKAFELLKGFVERPNAQPPDRNVRLRGVASYLDHLARQLNKPAEKPLAERCARQAETFYRAYLEKNPGHDWELVSLLARQGRIDEALDLFDRIWDNCSAVVVSQLCDFMAGRKLGVDQRERLSRILQAAIQRFGRLNPLLLPMADLAFRGGHYATAEEIYRELIQKSKGNASAASAMNNLAVLLAQQGVKLDEALKLVNQAIDILGPGGALLDSRASVYLAMGDTDKAQADLARALAENESAVWLFHQAQIHLRAGRREEAAAAMTKALHMPKPLTKDMLYPPEVGSFEQLSRLAGQPAATAGHR